MRSMFVTVPMQTGYGQITRVEVSLPYVDALISDDSGKYYMESKHIEDDSERRRYRHRGPTLRSLVKLAMACESTEEMGRKLKRRFDRQAQRQGVQTGPTRRDQAELERLMGDPGKRSAPRDAVASPWLSGL